MAGVANPNLKTFFQDSVITAARAAEVPNADFNDTNGNGCNRAASNSPGVGINTGDYNPKPTDWPREDPTYGLGQNIGTDNGVNNRITLDQGADQNDQVVFVAADASTAPDAVLNAAAAAVNRTGKTVPAGAFAWGSISVA